MKSAILRRISFVVVLAVVSQCAGQDQSLNEQDTKDVKDVADSNNNFSSDFYNTLRKTNTGNLIFSPFSLSSAMAMVKAGARGVTSQEIQKGMRFPSDDARLFNGYKNLLSALKSNENFTLETANRIYSQKGFTLNQNYVQTLKDSFKADATQLDFGESAVAAKNINEWVESITRDKIKDLISPNDLSALTRLVLVNAIYFKGQWANKFDPELTRKSPFYVSSTENITVDMMKREDDYYFADLTNELDARAISLPYKGNRLSMIVILPNKVDGLADLEKKLQGFNLASIPSRMQSRKISLSMPKFKLQTTIDLADSLKDLGMKSMFTDSADFGGIPQSPVPLKISKAVQKAFIEVNEEGSEASAATGFQLTLKSAFMGTQIKVDRPFLTTIFDNSTLSVLFVSTVTNPLLESSKVESLISQRSSLTDGGHGSAAIATLHLPAFFVLSLVLKTLTTFILS